MSHANVQLFRTITQSALEQAHRVYAGNNEAFTLFIEAFITTQEVRQIFTPAGLSAVMTDYMSDQTLRSYILNFESIFFSQVGDRHVMLKDLREVIADCVCFTKPAGADDQKKVLLPLEVTDPVASHAEAEEAMLHNRWLIPLLALILWSKPVYEFSEIKTGGKGGESKFVLKKVGHADK